MHTRYRPDPWWWTERRNRPDLPSERADPDAVRDFARRFVDANYRGRPSPDSRRRRRPNGPGQRDAMEVGTQ